MRTPRSRYEKDIQQYFFATIVSPIAELKDFLFQGFKCSCRLTAKPATPYDLDTLEIPKFQRPPPALLHRRFRMRFGQLAGLLLR